jgi:chemotaxis protein MotB
MSRRHARHRRHEDHANHEAWAIPYGDLVTLLLAFFVVMYSISSVNTGKYRQLSFSLVQAMQGATEAEQPIEGDGFGEGFNVGVLRLPNPILERNRDVLVNPLPLIQEVPPGARRLHAMAERLTMAMGGLIDRGLVDVRVNEDFIEVELKSDILFASGVGDVSQAAEPVIAELSAILRGVPNTIRVEGHTDDRPIHSAVYRSNWELSAARAASVVHLLGTGGVESSRLSVVAHAEQKPIRENESDAGRSANRRVVLIIANSESELNGLEKLSTAALVR